MLGILAAVVRPAADVTRAEARRSGFAWFKGRVDQGIEGNVTAYRWYVVAGTVAEHLRATRSGPTRSVIRLPGDMRKRLPEED
jgi:hypothetical protein